MINLSNKHSPHSSNAGDSSSRHSTIGKPIPNTTNANTSINMTNHNCCSPKKMRSQSQSPMSFTYLDPNTQYQRRFSYKLQNETNRATTKRRATTAVHCFKHLQESNRASNRETSSLINPELRNALSTSSKETDSSTRSMPHINIEANLPLIAPVDVYNSKMNSMKDITQSTTIVQNQIEEPQLPAYVVETC